MIFLQNIGHFFYVIAQYMERVDFRSVSAPCVSFTEGECSPYILSNSDLCVEFPSSFLRSIFNVSTMNIGNV